jgi:hypothetical protein
VFGLHPAGLTDTDQLCDHASLVYGLDPANDGNVWPPPSTTLNEHVGVGETALEHPGRLAERKR